MKLFRPFAEQNGERTQNKPVQSQFLQLSDVGSECETDLDEEVVAVYTAEKRKPKAPLPSTSRESTFASFSFTPQRSPDPFPVIKIWNCKICTLENSLEEDSCLACGMSRSPARTFESAGQSKKRPRVIADDDDDEEEDLEPPSRRSSSGKSMSEVIMLDSDESVGEEEASESSGGEEDEWEDAAEDPVDLQSNWNAAISQSLACSAVRSSREDIVDLTAVDDLPRPVKRARPVVSLNDDIEDFDDDFIAPPRPSFTFSEPAIKGTFTCVKDLKRLGCCAVDFSKFIMDNNAPPADLHHEKRKASREKKNDRKKAKPARKKGNNFFRKKH